MVLMMGQKLITFALAIAAGFAVLKKALSRVKAMADSYEIIDHAYDVVVVGAGGFQASRHGWFGRSGLKDLVYRRFFRLAAAWWPLSGVSTLRQRRGRMTGAGTCTTPLKVRTFGDQDAIEYMCREAIPAIIELEHYGVPSAAHRRARFISAPSAA